jgi:hypothetical protein
MGVKLVGVAGGSIGVDPFDRKTWSGSSHYFFSALNTVGVQPNALLRYALMARSFHPCRTSCRFCAFFDGGVWRDSRRDHSFNPDSR